MHRIKGPLMVFVGVYVSLAILHMLPVLNVIPKLPVFGGTSSTTPAA